MNYETAKKLKEAGYSQTMRSGTIVTDGLLYEDNEGPHMDNAYAPTLSELIEACPKIHPQEGYIFNFNLNWYEGRWYAEYEFTDGWCEGEGGTGSTPEIAVANLWLAINKKI